MREGQVAFRDQEADGIAVTLNFEGNLLLVKECREARILGDIGPGSTRSRRQTKEARAGALGMQRRNHSRVGGGDGLVGLINNHESCPVGEAEKRIGIALVERTHLSKPTYEEPVVHAEKVR